MEKTLYLSRLEPELAAALLVGVDALDPSGLSTPDSLHDTARHGQCYAATTDHGQAVYVVRIENGVAWVDACKGSGPSDWTAILLPVIEAQAKGMRAVGFQTRRPGLVRKAKQHGYSVAGWIMKKELT